MSSISSRKIILDLEVTLDGFIEGKNGEGRPLFIDIKRRLNLKLINTRTFSSGVVQLIYHLNKD